jgi:CRISPR type III-B/RAMP module-associated protein Cmr5
MVSDGKIPKPIELAVEIFLKIKSEVKDESIGSKLRHRAREIPELIVSMGLIPTLSYCFAKANSGEEVEPYRLYLRAILDYLCSLKFLKEDSEEALNKSVETIKNLSSISSVVTLFLNPFLIEFKRLCEATWKPERGEQYESH